MHGGLKIYRGTPIAARSYVEVGRSRADDYYLAEGSGLAQRFVARPDGVERRADMDGDSYERWVAGRDVETGAAKGRLRTDEQAVRFVEVTVNGEDLVAGSRAPSRDRRGLRRRSGPRRGRDHWMGGRARDHPGRAAGAAGAGAGRGSRLP